MEPKVSASTDERQVTSAQAARWQGARMGLMPLCVLALVVVATLAVATMARPFAALQGFFVEQNVQTGVLAVGLLVAAGGYGYTLVRSLRRVRQWYRDGQGAQADTALVALAATAVIVLLPVILAVVVPQHPAPF